MLHGCGRSRLAAELLGPAGGEEALGQEIAHRGRHSPNGKSDDIVGVRSPPRGFPFAGEKRIHGLASARAGHFGLDGTFTAARIDFGRGDVVP
jgi:hypothetical protein